MTPEVTKIHPSRKNSLTWYSQKRNDQGVVWDESRIVTTFLYHWRTNPMSPGGVTVEVHRIPEPMVRPLLRTVLMPPDPRDFLERVMA